MHVIKLKWWWWMLCLLILLKRIEALNFADLGLPNQSNCAFASNETLYIIGASKNVSLTFDSNDVYHNPPRIIAQQSRQTNTVVPACTITRSGKVLLMPTEPQTSLQIIENISPNLTVADTNMTFEGSQAAIDTFITGSNLLTNYTMTSFNDYVLIQGGLDANQTESQTTFILDLRYPALGVWYELQITSFTPPSSSLFNSALYATSRWILHFQTNVTNNQYTTYVDCFDPYTFLWLGTIASFNTTTNSIKAIPYSITATAESDSLLVIPSWSFSSTATTKTASSSTTTSSSSLTFATQGLNLSETTATNNEENQTTFWRLDISKWIFNNITITPIIINNIHSKTNQQKRDERQTSSNFFNPVFGGTVTLVAADLAVFYGGTTAADQQENILFFNTTAFKFLPQPLWLLSNNTSMQENTDGNKNSNNKLAIILGSVMGSILFIALLVLFVWCSIKRKRSRDKLGNEYHGNNKKSWLMSMSRSAKDSGTKNKDRPSPNMAEASSKQPYVLSPIQCPSPIDLFPAATTSDATDGSPAIKQEKKPFQSLPPLTSRFIEHFDYNSFPLAKNNTTNNHFLGNMASSSSSPQLKIATTATTADGSSEKQLPRSASSYV